ncbi:unnamed protein product [Rhizophagus irregularis]|nr:unnamed protein product [Rhizophagus irregularis]
MYFKSIENVVSIKFDIFWNELDEYFNEILTTLPDDDAVPSEGWIRLNFAPSNAHATKAMHYTGCFNVKYKVQSRLLRKSSEDEHYCRTMSVNNIKYRDYACLSQQIMINIRKVYVCYKDTVFQPSSALRHSTEFFNLVNR